MDTSIKEYIKNYDEGYRLGYRDSKNGELYCTNFYNEPMGTMTGYIHGWLHGIEKIKGRKVALDYMSEICSKLKKGIIVKEAIV